MNVDIRPLQEEDAYTSYKWRNDPDIWTYTKYSHKKTITLDDELNWIKKVINDEKDKRFAIIADGSYVGNVYLTGIENGSAEYHIFIGQKEFWGKGVAKKASEKIIDFGKNILKLNKIYLSVNANNHVAHRMYENFGFSDKGTDDDGFLYMELFLDE